MLAATALFAVAAVAAALADDPAYKEGVRLYEQVDLDGAIAKFNESLASSTSTDVEKATLHAWIALSHAQLGRKDDATSSFRAAVKLDRNVKLPALAPPDMMAQLESARAELPPEVKTAPLDPPDPLDPVDPTGPPPAASEGPPLISVVTGGAGIALLLASGATFAIALDTAFRQAFQAEFNDEARALVDLAYLEYAVAGGLAGAGVVGVGAAVVFTLE